MIKALKMTELELLKVTQVPRVVHDDLDVLDRPQATYPESFMSTSLVLAEI